ncbi:MAG: hypothetical protein U5L00_06725 [Desulfovermiculus sp.]|nr:hypothetical protein [Desulfovermiculus sp.]
MLAKPGITMSKLKELQAAGRPAPWEQESATTTTTTPSPAPAQPKPAATAQGPGPAPLTDKQRAVLQNVMSSQARIQAKPSPQAKCGGDFQKKVDEYQSAHNCKKSEAIGAVATEHPELHRQWLQGQQPGEPAPAAQTPGQKASEHEFMAQAKRLSAERSIPLSKAMGELSQRDPALHQRFLRDIQ